MKLENVEAATPELVEAVKRLLPQLTGSGRPLDTADLEATLGDGSSAMIIAREGEEPAPIVAMGTVAVYRTPTGIRAIIEDVVVDAAFRGRGTGEALVRALMDLARAKGAKGVSLTSNPHRASANRLYERIGFRRRSTNCYYVSLS